MVTSDRVIPAQICDCTQNDDNQARGWPLNGQTASTQKFGEETTDDGS
jgi:hypothetical protein